MASFPTPFGGVVTLYPLTEMDRRPTKILQFSDFSEQRWRQCSGMARFVLQMDRITYAEASAVKTFFDSAKGGFDNTWDIAIGGVTYDNMAFETDVFELKESERGIYSLRLPCRQTAA